MLMYSVTPFFRKLPQSAWRKGVQYQKNAVALSDLDEIAIGGALRRRVAILELCRQVYELLQASLQLAERREGQGCINWNSQQERFSTWGESCWAESLHWDPSSPPRWHLQHLHFPKTHITTISQEGKIRTNLTIWSWSGPSPESRSLLHSL